MIIYISLLIMLNIQKNLITIFKNKFTIFKNEYWFFSLEICVNITLFFDIKIIILYNT